MAEANVHDIEAIEQFLIQLRDFQHQLGKEQESARTEIERATRWIERESPDYWREQEKKARRKWVEARDSLLQCESVTRADDRPACSEHRKRLDKCTERVKECEKKLLILRQAQLEWQQVAQSTLLKIQHLVDLVESRLPLARHHLDRILEPLRQYAHLQSTVHRSSSISNADLSNQKQTSDSIPTGIGSTAAGPLGASSEEGK